MRIPLILKVIIIFLVQVSISAAGTLPSIAVFPLQELNRGRNEVNLPFTRVLTEQLAASGNEIQDHETVISFMANNRIRTVGHLETYHISRAGEDLGVAFVLLGTVTQLKEHPSPSMGVTLQLVRTNDTRTVWSYVGHFSAGDERRILGIGEPTSVSELQPFLLEDILSQWPWEMIREMQGSAAISIDSIRLQPNYLRPGAEVSAKVRLRNDWPAGRAPRVFFKTDDQIHAAAVSDDDSTYEATWIAGEKDGRFPVTLLLEWPLYGRSETALLGAYVVDGAPPLLEMDFKGTTATAGTPVFRNELVIVPRLLVSKPLARWRLAFLNSTGELVGADEGSGNLPEVFVWQGRGNTKVPVGSGGYDVLLEVWDQAGNNASVTRRVEMNRNAPEVELAVAKNGTEMVLDLEHDGKVPLAFWRMEMWTREGRIIKLAEGRQLPSQVGFELPSAEGEEEIQGFLTVQDVLGNQTRRDMNDFFQKLRQQETEATPEEPSPALSESWVDDF